MVSVLVAGDEKGSLFSAVRSALQGRKGILFSSGTEGLYPRQNARAVISPFGGGTLPLPHRYLLLLGPVPLTTSLPFPPDTVAAFFAEAPIACRQVRDWGITAVPCGISDKNTFTFSSRTSDRAVVSLQRSVPCLFGGIAEPREIPFRITQPCSDFQILAAAAAAVLLECIEEGEGLEISSARE